MEPEKPERSLSELGREELYELVWAKPVRAVAGDFGISTGAVATQCKRHDVPRPSRGYWTKKEAGKNPRRVPLPPVDAEIAEKPARKLPALPTRETTLHPLAGELLAAIQSGSVGRDGRVDVRRAAIPEVSVTKELAERTANAFHAIIEHTEPVGIFFRKAQVDYHGGFFRKGHDRLYLKIEEGLVEKAETGPGDRLYTGWQQQPTRKTSSGLLMFSLSKESWHYHGAKQWNEDRKSPLRKVLRQIVVEMRRHFAEARRRRAKLAIEHERHRVKSHRLYQEYLQNEAIRQQGEREERHTGALVLVGREREQNLFNAAELWHRHRLVEDFLATCEGRWRSVQDGMLTLEQERWLRWAHETNSGLSPFKAGYPDPLQDGPFDAGSVPFGGPYPETRKFVQ